MLSKKHLIDVALGGLDPSEWHVTMLTTSHPFDFVGSTQDEAVRCRMFIWNVTHGGATRADDEFRIQITGVDPPLVAPAGTIILILGWQDELGVIAAFDPSRHVAPAAGSPSIQISHASLVEAADIGIAFYRRGNDELAIALRPDHLPTYLRHQRELHDLGADAEALIDLEHLLLAPEDLDGAEFEVELELRPLVIATVVRRYRAARFRRQVLKAYGYGCAACGIALNLVDAAHIVPVAVDGSTDHVSNGLALCRLHHAAYDSGLFGVAGDFAVCFADDRIAVLDQDGRGSGAHLLKQDVGEQIRLPENATDRPRPDLLDLGLQLRGWNVG